MLKTKSWSKFKHADLSEIGVKDCSTGSDTDLQSQLIALLNGRIGATSYDCEVH